MLAGLEFEPAIWVHTYASPESGPDFKLSCKRLDSGFHGSRRLTWIKGADCHRLGVWRCFVFGLAGTPFFFTIVIRKSVKSVNPYKIGMPGIIRMKRITRINGLIVFSSVISHC